MVAKIHFDFERTVAKFRLREKLREHRDDPPPSASASPSSRPSRPARRHDLLPVLDAGDRLTAIERRLAKRRFF